MMRDLLVPWPGMQAGAAALEAAIALAARHEARVVALIVVPLYIPPGFEWGAIPADLYARVHEDERARGRASAAQARERLEAAGVRHEVRVVEARATPPSHVAALHARHADLTVMAGRLPEETAAATEALFTDLLFDSGRPLLLVPPGYEALPASPAVIAWSPTREAARAVHDALPLLHEAARVDVLMIDPQRGDDGHGDEPGADLAAHLARHGLDVRVVVQARHGDSVAHCLLRHVAGTGAGLLVAGGYGHARVREQWLGGVTRTLLEQARVPVLFSH